MGDRDHTGRRAKRGAGSVAAGDEGQKTPRHRQALEDAGQAANSRMADDKDGGQNGDPPLAEAKLDLTILLRKTQDRFQTDITDYLKIDAAIIAEPIEEGDILADPVKGAKKVGEDALDKTVELAGDRGKDLAEKIAEGAGLTPGIGTAVEVMSGGYGIVKKIFDARHSVAHRRAQAQVIRQSQALMDAWCVEKTAAIRNAATMAELRAIGNEIVVVLEAAKNEVSEIQLLQARVLALETQDPSFTSTEIIDDYHTQREALRRAFDGGKQ